MSAKKSLQLQVRLDPETEKKFRELATDGGSDAAKYARKLIELAVEWAEMKGRLPSPPAITERTYLASLEAEIISWTAGSDSAPGVGEARSLKNLETVLLQIQAEKNAAAAKIAAHKQTPTPP